MVGSKTRGIEKEVIAVIVEASDDVGFEKEEEGWVEDGFEELVGINRLFTNSISTPPINIPSM